VVLATLTAGRGVIRPRPKTKPLKRLAKKIKIDFEKEGDLQKDMYDKHYDFWI
jgi:hypothetical protein